MLHYFLKQLIPPNSGKPIVIHINEDEVPVGRKRIHCLTQFPQISREHAVFYRTDADTVFVKDQNSLNGVFVNDIKIGSSLKSLSTGDIIGFGVTSAAANEGFVCVLCAENRPNPEVIEISDDELEVVGVSDRKLNSGNSGLQTSCLGKTEPLRSKTNIESAHCDEALQTSCLGKTELLHSKSNIESAHCDEALQTSCLGKTELLRSKTNIESEHCDENKNPVEIHEIRNTPESRKDVQNFERRVQKRSTEVIPVKKCLIPVVRCDSEDFQVPSGVKCPFTDDNEHKNKPLNRRKKRARVLSSDSSEDSEGGVQPVTSSKDNLPTDIEFKDKSDCQTDTGRKRKSSEISCCETSNDVTSTSNDNNPGDGSYSQVEDIIYISDDEEYLDFNSSQNYVEIKKEPEELEDYKEIFERESNNEHECASYSAKEHDLICKDSDDRVESIESILAFMSNSEQSSKVLRPDLSAGTNYAQRNNSRSPVPSRDTDSESSEDTDTALDDDPFNQSAIHNSEEEYQTDTIPPQKKNLNKSGGKILLIDPKPMTYRPRRLRGRDEGFVERSKPLDQLTSVAREQKEKRKKKSLKNAIPDTRPKKLKISRNHKPEVHIDTVQRSENNSNPSQTASTSSPKKSCIKTRPEKFSSRMAFLTNEMEVKPQRGNKSKKCGVSKSIHLDKKSILQNSVAKNRNVSEGDKNAQNGPVPTPSPRNEFANSSQTSNTGANSFQTSNAKANSFQASNTEAISLQACNTGAISFQASNTGANSTKYITQSSMKSGESSRGYYAKEKQPRQIISNNNTNIRSFNLPHVSGKTPSSITDSSLPSKISFDGVMKRLLQMNTKWLQEQTALKIPPSPVSKGAADLPLSYRSYDSYVSSFYPMIMLEIWEYMFTESQEVYASNKQYKKFYFSILSYTSRKDCIELKCESVINEKVCFGPREGVMAVLELKENSRKCSPLFGYIFKHRVESLNLSNLKLSQWKNLPEVYLQNARHWTFHAFIKKKDMPFELTSLMKGNGLCYIRSKLRLADALHFIQNSPLLRDILTPREATFSANRFLSSPSREYTSSQTEVINRISNEISKPYMQPKIVLVHGPPGTGKTHVIIGLLEKLFFNAKNISNPKILITAPSNEAIDEIGCRLVELNERSGWRDNNIKFIRVGLEKQIHPKVMPFFVDKKAKDLYQQSSSYYQTNLKDAELGNLLSEINKLEMDPPNKTRNERIKYLRDKYKHGREKSYAKPMDYYTEMMYKTSILKESDIILSTLSSCGLSLLHKSFKSNSNAYFSCCIIDDATQCTELEALQPLAFGISKLVLVGDHEQLPVSVLSKLASQYGFERSMFERFHLCFQKLNQNPVLTLTEQFRMHAAICEFPSKYFYAQKLVTHPDTILRYKTFPLNPYIVIDVLTHPDSLDSPNKAEIHIISTICGAIVDSTDFQSSIGIIVSHQAKRSYYMKTLYSNPYYKHIEINTVDGFQGREKDVIVLCALNADTHQDGVRFLSSKQQLNVAITRARKCLIVCASSTELMVYPDWSALIFDAHERKVCKSLSSPRHLSSILENCVKKKRR